jgi:hypothetical protein
VTWAQRLWLVLLLTLASGVATAVGGFDARGHLGALILTSLLGGALLVFLTEIVSTRARPAAHSPTRVLAGMLAVLVPASAVASVLLDTPTPFIIVAVFGGMAAPLMLRR